MTLPGQQEVSEGTSFAAPRVAAGMAALHGKYPQLSSAEVEARLKSQLTKGGSVASLDEEKTRQFLQSQSF